MINSDLKNELVLVCNPFANIGRATAAIYLFRALKTVNLFPKICDVSSLLYNKPDEFRYEELSQNLISTPGLGINIYVLNVDEIEPSKEFLGDLKKYSYNILYPAWELAKCPKEWEKSVLNFDEIWAPSKFVKDAFSRVFDKHIEIIPHPVEISFSHFLTRSHFGLPDHPYLFLFFFDFRSYIERKNPYAIFEAFKRLNQSYPNADIRLIIKVSGANSNEKSQIDYQLFLDMVSTSDINLRKKIIILNGYYSDNEIYNLIRCCDCFISLHRSEGFGLGLAEAMFLEKPVIATNYSGNKDFMTSHNSFLVNFDFIDINQGEYPNYEGQKWANPKLEQTVNLMSSLIKNPKVGKLLGIRASQDIRKQLSYLSVGLVAKKRINKIIKPR